VVSEVSRKPACGYLVTVGKNKGAAMKSDRKTGGLVTVKAARFSAEIDAELFNRAEKELAAFIAAVNTRHGEERARAAADDWLLELTALKEPCKGESLDLRSVTIGAAMRLARRLSIQSPAAIQSSVRQNVSPQQRRAKQHSPAQENVIHATTSGRISHAVLAVIAGILLLAPASARAVRSISRHLVTQNKPVKVVVIRSSSVSRKHEFQQDSDHPSKNSHNVLCDVRFTHSCEQRVGSIGQN